MGRAASAVLAMEVVARVPRCEERSGARWLVLEEGWKNRMPDPKVTGISYYKSYPLFSILCISLGGILLIYNEFLHLKAAH